MWSLVYLLMSSLSPSHYPLRAKRREVGALGEQVALFKEALTAKDHVVVELTNQVFQLEHKGQVPNK